MPLAYPAALASVRLLPPAHRERLGLGWTHTQQAQLRALGAGLRSLTPVLPERVRVTGPQIANRLEDLVPDEATVARAAQDLPAHIGGFRGWALTWIAAWNARDLDAITAHVTDDIIYDDPGMWGELVTGKTAFRANLEQVFRGFPNLYFLPADWPTMFSLDGQHVSLATRAITTFSGDLAGGPSKMALAGTNRPLDVFCLDLYQFRDGKLCRGTALNQEFELARQAGFAPTGTMMTALVHAQRATAPIMRMLAKRSAGQ